MRALIDELRAALSQRPDVIAILMLGAAVLLIAIALLGGGA